MNLRLRLPLCLLVLTVSFAAVASASAPFISGENERSLSSSDDNLIATRREVYGNGRIFDITHRYSPSTPCWDYQENGLGQFIWFPRTMKNGSVANFSVFKLPNHAGTHVDAPGHMIDHYFDAGFDVDTLDLGVLNGPALLVDVPRDKNITAEVMKSLNIPKGITRVLFRTLNTDRNRLLVSCG